jgi:hypothetical protein
VTFPVDIEDKGSGKSSVESPPDSIEKQFYFET